MNYFTADSHFSLNDETVISRDYRPFGSLIEMNERIINIWNDQAKENDFIYHLGDFVNYNFVDLEYDNLFTLVKKIKAKVILVLGNNERRILDNRFGGNFENFKTYLQSIGFFNVYEKELNLKIGDHDFKLVHCPTDADKTSNYNLFGHIHRSVFVKKYGFNVGVDNHNYKLFSEEEIQDLYDRRKFYDENVYN